MCVGRKEPDVRKLNDKKNERFEFTPVDHLGDNVVTSLIRIAQAFPMLVAYMYIEVLYGNVKIYG